MTDKQINDLAIKLRDNRKNEALFYTVYNQCLKSTESQLMVWMNRKSIQQIDKMDVYNNAWQRVLKNVDVEKTDPNTISRLKELFGDITLINFHKWDGEKYNFLAWFSTILYREVQKKLEKNLIVNKYLVNIDDDTYNVLVNAESEDKPDVISNAPTSINDTIIDVRSFINSDNIKVKRMAYIIELLCVDPYLIDCLNGHHVEDVADKYNMSANSVKSMYHTIRKRIKNTYERIFLSDKTDASFIQSDFGF